MSRHEQLLPGWALQSIDDAEFLSTSYTEAWSKVENTYRLQDGILEEYEELTGDHAAYERALRAASLLGNVHAVSAAVNCLLKANDEPFEVTFPTTEPSDPVSVSWLGYRMDESDTHPILIATGIDESGRPDEAIGLAMPFRRPQVAMLEATFERIGTVREQYFGHARRHEAIRSVFRKPEQDCVSAIAARVNRVHKLIDETDEVNVPSARTLLRIYDSANTQIYTLQTEEFDAYAATLQNYIDDSPFAADVSANLGDLR